MTVPLINALPLIALLAVMTVAGFAVSRAERCIRARCVRPCCVPTHDRSPAALDGHRASSSISLRSEL